VTVDRSALLDRFLAILRANRIPFCVIGGQGVNAYAEPVVSLDLDVVVAASDLSRLEPILAATFAVERFPHSLNVSAPDSDLRVQLQLDPRYGEFVGRAVSRHVLGETVPVARVEDVLQGKVWAAQDPGRRASKRLKDLADIARLLEVNPGLRSRVPAEVLERLV
jgi:hypothetical protein